MNLDVIAKTENRKLRYLNGKLMLWVSFMMVRDGP